MNTLISKIKAFVNEEDGASAVEYGLLVAGIAVAVMTAVYAIGTTLSTKFGEVNTALNAGS
ncbi:MAG: Flp family type IVb pilin [Deltaproteobacteria bacterium]|nr:Flp family type IVb pilin [Deltaproteobacteria bacterium]